MLVGEIVEIGVEVEAWKEDEGGVILLEEEEGLDRTGDSDYVQSSHFPYFCNYFFLVPLRVL